MPRAGLSRDRVIAIALDVAGDGGPVTLGAVAARAGVRVPSLYKHVTSAAELDSLVAEHVLVRLADHVDAALGPRDGVDAVAATLHAYRDFARTHPTLYGLLPVQPGNDPRLRPHARQLMTRVATAIGHPGLDHPEALHALRLIRSAAEGFIRLERAGGFGEPADVATSWDRLVDAIASSVASSTGR